MSRSFLRILLLSLKNNYNIKIEINYDKKQELHKPINKSKKCVWFKAEKLEQVRKHSNSGFVGCGRCKLGLSCFTVWHRHLAGRNCRPRLAGCRLWQEWFCPQGNVVCRSDYRSNGRRCLQQPWNHRNRMETVKRKDRKSSISLPNSTGYHNENPGVWNNIRKVAFWQTFLCPLFSSLLEIQ